MTLVKNKISHKQKTGHKKRTAMHHRKSNNYVKVYLPYITVLFVFLLAFTINSSLNTKSKVLGSSSDFSDHSLLESTNTERLKAKLYNLTLSTQLDNAAQSKANDMVANNYWSHNSPSGQTPYSFIVKAGYNFQIAGENLAYGFNNASDTIKAWMNSPEHRANLLNVNYKDVGFGVASSPNFNQSGPETVVVAMYAAPVSDAVTNITFTVPPPSSVLGTTSLNNVNNLQPPTKFVSRIQLLTGGKAIWSLSVISFITGAVICFFLIKHGRRFKKLFIDGEQIIVHNYLLDIALLGFIAVGFILTRTSGFIG